jgi:hypothetical protein
MTVTNHGSTPDALTRMRCPVARATEPRTTDRGEGGLSSRAVKSIAIRRTRLCGWSRAACMLLSFS